MVRNHGIFTAWSGSDLFQLFMSSPTHFGTTLACFSFFCSSLNPLFKLLKKRKVESDEINNNKNDTNKNDTNNNDIKKSNEKGGEIEDEESAPFQPVLLVIDSILLTLNLTCIGRILSHTEHGLDLFRWKRVDLSEQDSLRDLAQLSLAVLTLSDFLVMIINVLRNRRPMPRHVLFNQLIWTTLLFFGSREATSSVDLLPLTSILVHRTSYIAFLLTTTLSKFIRPTPLSMIDYQVYVGFVFLACMETIALGQVYQMYQKYQTCQNNCGNKSIQIWTVFYTQIVIFSSPVLYINRTLSVRK